MKLNFSEKKKYTVKVKDGLEVVVEPLSMTRENELLRLCRIERGSSKIEGDLKGKNMVKAVTLKDDIDHLENNILVAQESWKSWDLVDSTKGKPVKCNSENIRYLFDHFFKLANDVVVEFNNMVEADNETLGKEKKT
jgi:hypothetical protein